MEIPNQAINNNPTTVEINNIPINVEINKRNGKRERTLENTIFIKTDSNIDIFNKIEEEKAYIVSKKKGTKNKKGIINDKKVVDIIELAGGKTIMPKYHPNKGKKGTPNISDPIEMKKILDDHFAYKNRRKVMQHKVDENRPARKEEIAQRIDKPDPEQIRLDNIAKAQEYHNKDGLHYIYDKAMPYELQTITLIFCIYHDEYFTKTFSDHLRKDRKEGCPKCSAERAIIKRSYPIEHYINKYYAKHTDGNHIIQRQCNRKEYFEIKCMIHNYTYEQFKYTAFAHECVYCGFDKTKAKLTHTTPMIKNKFIEKFGDAYDYSMIESDGTSNPLVKIGCKKHNGFFMQRTEDHYSGKGCGFCAGNQKKDTKIFIDQSLKIKAHLDKKGDHKYNYDKVNYINNEKKVIIYCKHHNNYFLTRPVAHLSGSGCPRIHESRGESAIHLYLTENKIKYKSQKSFPDCKDKNLLRFDFYLPDLNCMIEFDGKQHYIPVKYYGGEKTLLEIKKRDMIKNNYCIKNNIDLLRIPYHKEKNIDNLLNDFINNLKMNIEHHGEPQDPKIDDLHLNVNDVTNLKIIDITNGIASGKIDLDDLPELEDNIEIEIYIPTIDNKNYDENQIAELPNDIKSQIILDQLELSEFKS